MGLVFARSFGFALGRVKVRRNCEVIVCVEADFVLSQEVSMGMKGL